MNSSDVTKLITFKNIIRVVAILLIILFFVPSFVVSCSGYDVKLSAAKLMVGAKMQGYTVTKANPICIFFLLLPIAMLVLWCLKSVLKDKIAALVCGCCAAADLIFWIILRAAITSRVHTAGYESGVKAGFIFNILFLLAMITLNLLIFLNVIQAETPLIKLSAQPGYNPAQQPMQGQPMQGQPMQGQQFNQVPPVQQAAPGNMGAGFCENCGAPLVAGNKFCTKCGTKVEL